MPYQTGEAPKSYEAQVRASYLANPVAARAIRLISEGAGGAPLVSNPAGHPALALLASTGFGASGPGLLETLSGAIAIARQCLCGGGNGARWFAGGVVCAAPRTGDGGGRQPRLAGWLSVSRRGGSNALSSGIDGRSRRVAAHIRAYHPLDDHYGVGCLGAAAAAVDVHNAAAKWNRALLDNAARPSGAILYQPGDGIAVERPNNIDRLKAEMESGFAGAANAGRPMLLEGGLSWQAMSLTPAEMDFARARDTAAREIALAFGVPPVLLGLPGDATYANYKEANIALWRLTLLPLTGRILAALSAHLQHWWPGLEVRVDRDAVPALSEDRERLWSQVSNAAFLSDPEKRALLGLEVAR